MICPICGTRLPKGVVKCHFCGSILKEDSTNLIERQDLLLEKMVACSLKQEEISNKLVEISNKQDEILKTTAPGNLFNSDRCFLEKYAILITLLALWVALIVYFNGYVDSIGKDLVSNAVIRASIAIIMATLLTGFYWLLTPLMVHTLIDTQKPFTGSFLEVVILFLVYLLFLVGNFSLIPNPYSLVTFLLLTLIFAGCYRYLSQNKVIFKN